MNIEKRRMGKTRKQLSIETKHKIFLRKHMNNIKTEKQIDDIVIKMEGDFTLPLSALVKQAFEDADTDKFKLSEATLSMLGMSGRKYRKFINNFIGTLDDVRYLETGSLKGSTVCAAMEGNKLKARCIENWHWPEHRPDFFKNTQSVITDDIDFDLIESDFRAVDYNNIGSYNVYLFDGPHSARDQYDGVYLAQPALDDTYVLIVDDWNWAEVQQGTNSALAYLKSNVLAKIEVFALEHSAEFGKGNETSQWHNGYFIAVIAK
jgi:hypothetical protein